MASHQKKSAREKQHRRVKDGTETADECDVEERWKWRRGMLGGDGREGAVYLWAEQKGVRSPSCSDGQAGLSGEFIFTSLQEESGSSAAPTFSGGSGTAAVPVWQTHLSLHQLWTERLFHRAQYTAHLRHIEQLEIVFFLASQQSAPNLVNIAFWWKCEDQAQKYMLICLFMKSMRNLSLHSPALWPSVVRADSSLNLHGATQPAWSVHTHLRKSVNEYKECHKYYLSYS